MTYSQLNLMEIKRLFKHHIQQLRRKGVNKKKYVPEQIACALAPNSGSMTSTPTGKWRPNQKCRTILDSLQFALFSSACSCLLPANRVTPYLGQNKTKRMLCVLREGTAIPVPVPDTQWDDWGTHYGGQPLGMGWLRMLGSCVMGPLEWGRNPGGPKLLASDTTAWGKVTASRSAIRARLWGPGPIRRQGLYCLINSTVMKLDYHVLWYLSVFSGAVIFEETPRLFSCDPFWK